MATVSRPFVVNVRAPDQLSGTPRAHAVDRWIFVIMASWFIAIALTGFIPDSLAKIAAVESGQAPPLPLVMHLHATLMGSFLLLLLIQSVLMATGKAAMHQRLGIAAFALVPAMVIVGLLLVPAAYHSALNAAQAAPPEMQAKAHKRLFILEDALLFQLRAGLLFPLFMGLGLWARGFNVGFHKRMMFLGPATALGAAVTRIAWLPTDFPSGPLFTSLYMLLTVAPMFAWDVIRNRRVHAAYWIWLAVNVPAAVVIQVLWGTAAWHSAAKHVIGI